jgi:hypothetical protein
MNVETKAFVTLTEMAKMLGLSRARLYQLLGTAFPWPIYDVSTKRPFYDEELQKVCLEVRRRNCGIDGKPIMFYCKRVNMLTPKRIPKVADKSGYKCIQLLDGLRALGLQVASAQAVAAAKELFPGGVDGIDQGEVVRKIFIHLKRQGV